MPTVGIGLSLRIHGTRSGGAKLAAFRALTATRINAALVKEVPDAEQRMQEAVQAHFTTGEGSGQTARSIGLEIRPGKTGASVRFRIGTSRQTKYLTSLLPDSEFQAKPYFITIRDRQWLRFNWKAMGGIHFAKRVMHPGFGTDVLREQGEVELANLANIVQMEVANVTSSIFKREGTYFDVGD